MHRRAVGQHFGNAGGDLIGVVAHADDRIGSELAGVLDPSTRAPALAGASCSGFRPTGLPAGLHHQVVRVGAGALAHVREQRDVTAEKGL